MKKRLLALFLVLALLITCLPMGAVAEGTETLIEEVQQTTEQEKAPVRQPSTKDTTPQKGDHKADIHFCEHCNAFVEWEAWGNDEDTAEKTSLPVTTNHYYLVADVNGSA